MIINVEQRRGPKSPSVVDFRTPRLVPYWPKPSDCQKPRLDIELEGPKVDVPCVPVGDKQHIVFVCIYAKMFMLHEIHLADHGS